MKRIHLIGVDHAYQYYLADPAYHLYPTMFSSWLRAYLRDREVILAAEEAGTAYITVTRINRRLVLRSVLQDLQPSFRFDLLSAGHERDITGRR